MRQNGLSCRVYRINKQVLFEVKNVLKKPNNEILYETYRKGTPDEQKLYFSVKDYKKNEHGTLFEIFLDKIIFIPTRDGEKPILQTPTYFIQLLENTEQFSDHLIIYGAKLIDSSIKKAFENHLRDILNEDVNDALILLKIDFEKISQLVREFQNIQHFCIKDVNDDRVQDVIIKGDMLEKTLQYKEFVIEDDTKGDLNFLGITMDGKLLYIGRDGSIYSRNNFAKNYITGIVYSLLQRIASRHALCKTLDENY